MTAGSAVPTLRTWLITALQAVTGPAEALDGVRVQYSPITNLDQALGDNGSIEAIYWGETDSTTSLRGMKGSANVKYQESAQSTLVLVVAARNVDDTLEQVEARGADLLGEIVRVFQATDLPYLDGHHVVAWVEGWETNPGRLASGGVIVHAAAWDIDVRVNCNIEL